MATDDEVDWHELLDGDPVQRGPRMNIKRIDVDGKTIDLETTDQIRLMGTFNGFIELKSKSTVSSDEDPAVAKARQALQDARGAVEVDPVITMDAAMHRMEEGEAKQRRIEGRYASDMDVTEYLATQIGNYLTLPEIHAGLYHISIPMAAAETFTGNDPLFAPEFDHLDTLKAKRSAFKELPAAKQLELRQRYGKVPATHKEKGVSSDYRNKCITRREQLKELLEICKEAVLRTGDWKPFRLVEFEYRNRKKASVPQAVKDHWASLKLIDASNNSVYWVMPE